MYGAEDMGKSFDADVNPSSLTGTIRRLDNVVESVQVKLDELSKKLDNLGIVIHRPDKALDSESADTPTISPIVEKINLSIDRLQKIKMQLEYQIYNIDN